MQKLGFLKMIVEPNKHDQTRHESMGRSSLNKFVTTSLVNVLDSNKESWKIILIETAPSSVEPTLRGC